MMNGNANAISSTLNASSLGNGLLPENIESLDKQQLIQMVISLTNTVSKLQEDYSKVINLRLYNLERNFNMSQQYLRRDSLQITGIPT